MDSEECRPFVVGRRNPTESFKYSVSRQLRMIDLVDDADHLDRLDLRHPAVYSLYRINDALHGGDRTAGWTPGKCQRDFLSRLQEGDHSAVEALEGLVSVGIEDMARAHGEQLRTKPKTEERRPERHTRAVRVRPLKFPERSV